METEATTNKSYLMAIKHLQEIVCMLWYNFRIHQYRKSFANMNI